LLVRELFFTELDHVDASSKHGGQKRGHVLAVGHAKIQIAQS
jgi:hypothetical protein